MTKATIVEVAKRAGVSIKTVSRVINLEPNVRAATAGKVRKAIQDLGFRPDQSARNLAGNRSNLIVLVYDDPSHYELPSAGYIIEMQQGLLRVCRSTFSELLIHPCDYNDTNVANQLSKLIEQAKPAGIVLSAPLSNVPRIVETIEASDTPCVLLSPGESQKHRLSVSTSDREASAAMVEHLRSLGHTRIAFISGHPGHAAVNDRLVGYEEGLMRCGVPQRMVEEGDNSFGSGILAARKLLSRKEAPTAVFAANDDMAAGVLRAAAQLGIQVPQSLSVAGFDDIALARQVSPSLTTIRQPLAEMAERAASLLVTSRTGTRQHEDNGSQVVPATIQIRESTGPVVEE